MKTDPRVDAYIGKSADFARPILRHLRRLVHEGCPEAEETMKWSSPSFVTGGKILCGMAAFKEHCTFGFWHKEMEAVLERDGALAGGAMGSFGRIASLADLPSDEKMRDYVRRAAKLNEDGTPARPRPAAKRAAPAVPSDLASALKKSRAAAATFQKLSPGQRKEYVDWITAARREETRARRLATALEWLAEGKKRNWKYESC